MTPDFVQTGRPRVGVDLHVLEGIHQGSRTHCFELFSRVTGLTPEIDYFFFVDTKRWDAANAAVFSRANAQVVHMPHANPFVRLVVELPRLVRRHGIDLLHTQYICPPAVSCANAVTIHDILFEEYGRYFSPFLRLRSKLLFRISARRARMVFTVSEYSRKQLHLRYGIDSDAISTIPNGADLTRFFSGPDGAELVAALGLSPGEYLLTVGRLEPRKNHPGLLRAYAQLPTPRPRLLIVGQRDFGYRHIFDLTRQLQLEQDVQFLETADNALLAALYRHCKAFLYPTFAEGFGLPVVEAMASGAPVITSNSTALPEIAGDAALLVDPSSSTEIRDALQRILDQPALREHLTARGLERAGHFSWEPPARTLAGAYRSFFKRI